MASTANLKCQKWTLHQIENDIHGFHTQFEGPNMDSKANWKLNKMDSTTNQSKVKTS